MFRAISTAAILLSCSLSFAAATRPDLVALEAFASDAYGSPVQPKQAESFYCSMRFRVDGPLNRLYAIRFDSPYQSLTTPNLSFGQGVPGEFQVTWGPMAGLSDQPILVKATLVPKSGLRELNSRNNVATFVVNPIAPDSGIEYFAPKRLQGRLDLVIRWNMNPGQTTTWFPKPITSSFQEASITTPPIGITVDADGAFISNLPAENNSLANGEEFETTASSKRINRGILRSATFADYFQEPEANRWLQPETYVESLNLSIKSFGATARSKATNQNPFDVAESIYKSVLARCAYSSRKAVPSAYNAYRYRRGDCGGLSSLFVAACRAQGIPARTVTGFTLGENQWHVWAEFLIPGHGWVACDPAYAKGALAKSALPIYFGVMPDLNRRVACTFGFDVTANGQTLPLLQAPTVFWTNGQARPTSGVATSRLSVAD